MHATIDAQFTVSLDPDKTLPLATLAESLTEIQLEATILEEIVRSLDERLVEAYCGEKHARGNGDRRFQRAGTTTRTAVTTAGEHEFTLHHVKDTAATEDDPTYFRPLEAHVDSTDSASIKRIFRFRVPTSLRHSAFVMPSPTATGSNEIENLLLDLLVTVPDCNPISSEEDYAPDPSEA